MATPLREIFARFGVDFDTRELERGDQKTKATTRSLGGLDEVANVVSGSIKTLGASIAGVFAVGAINDMITGTIRATQEIERWSQRLNTNVESITAWSRVAEPFGVELEDMADGLKELQLKAQDALTGGTAQAEMFGRIGISLNDLRPVVNDVNGLMDLFVDRLDDVNDAGLRNFTVDELMSDAGTRLLPVFRMGSERLRELRDEAARAARPTAELAERMTSWQVTTGRAGAALESLKATFVLSILPAMERGAEATVDIINKFQKLTEETNLLKAAAVTLGGVLVGVAAKTAPAWAPVVVSVLAVGLAVAGVVLVLEDIFTTMEGGDTVTRRFIDGMFGVGATAKAINNVGLAWRSLKQDMEEVARFIASTPSLNLLTGGIFERSLGGGEEQETARRQRETLSGGVFESNYVSRRERLATQAGRRTALSLSRRRQEREELDEWMFLDRGAAGRRGRSVSDDLQEDLQMSIPSRDLAQRDEEAAQEIYGVDWDPGRSNGPVTVSLNQPINITVNGDIDPRQTANLVQGAVREELDREARQIEAALVPEGTS